ncbi:MAG TPA: RNA polymerase sigma factor [Actinomycetota bacterium]
MDQVSWEWLYAEHADRVLAYARRRVDPQDAPDVVAETFLAAWRRREVIPTDALPWLYAVARNVISNSRRAERRRDALRGRLAVVRTGDGEDPVARVDDQTVVISALRQLPPMEREALMLVTWEDLEPHRAAAALGCSAAALRVRLHRGRRKLRGLLNAGTGPSFDPEGGVPDDLPQAGDAGW